MQGRFLRDINETIKHYIPLSPKAFGLVTRLEFQKSNQDK